MLSHTFTIHDMTRFGGTRDPTGEEQRRRGVGRGQGIESVDRTGVKKVARVVERHKHHHEPAPGIKRTEATGRKFRRIRGDGRLGQGAHPRRCLPECRPQGGEGLRHRGVRVFLALHF